MLYNGYKSEWKGQQFQRRLHRSDQDADYEYYLFEGIPQEDWDIFWTKWGKMTDFYDKNHSNRYWLPYFVYVRLDLESSEATVRVDKEFEEFEDDQGQSYETSEPLYKKDKNSLY